MSDRRRMLGSVVTVTVVLGVLLGVHRIATDRLLAAYVVALAAIVLLYLVRVLGHPAERQEARFEQALRRPKAPSSLQAVELLRMERELLLGIANADSAHRRLVPLLRAAAAARLSARHGFELERRPEMARSLLGEDVWDVVRPDRPAPSNRHAPGVPRERVAAVIDRVESL